MSLAWNPSSVKAQCKLASHELRQLKDRKDSQNFIIRKDIAALLRQQNVWLAREKAQNLLTEDTAADLLERLETHVELLLERLSELNSKSPLSPMVVEAVATIVYAAPHLDSRNLQAIRNLLLNRFGPDFAGFATSKSSGHVSPVVIQSLSPLPPSAYEINACLAKIALAFNVDWAPEPTRHEIVDSLARMVSGSSQSIDLSALRRLCRYGIPDKPSWLRPRIWKLVLCLESTTESTWTAELRKQRHNYYDLVRQFLGPFSTAEAPSVPLSPLDASLLDISKQLSRIPTHLFAFLQKAPDTSLLCPLDPDAPDNIKISSANNLVLRLAALRNQPTPTPKIQSNGQDPLDHTQTKADPPLRVLQTTFLAADLLKLPKVDPKHASALLRILYIHAMINPGILSPHVPSLLIPLYTALTQEDDGQEDAVHPEADTFWLFEAMMAEFSELEDENISNMWLRKFGERVAWADKNLHDILCARQLDPALPHYSYRWLATLLTHSLPFSSIFPVWDVLFSRPTRSRGTNPKLDHLLDVCTAMLLCARPTLLRAHSEQERTEASEYLPEDSDAFMEAMTFLQNYRIESAGGIGRILQTANDLLQHRHDEPKARMGFRIKETVFGGFTNQLTSSSESDSDAKDEEDSQTDTFTGRIATTLWRGITNQAAMEPPPSPPSPSTPTAQSPPQLPPDEPATNAAQWSSAAYSTLWGYAERIQDSDTAAALAKVSSNWKAKTLVATWGRTENGREVNGDSPPIPGALEKDTKPKRQNDASPSRPSSTYSPPPRPAFFRPPRDSRIPSDTEKLLLSSLDTSLSSLATDSGIISRTKASLAAATRSPPLRSAPRPLILSSGSSITPTSLPRLPNSAPAPDSHTWDNIKVRKGTHRDSLSSVSSVSDSMSQPLNCNTSDRDSDISGSSRRILLNRKSVSPLAPQYRTQHLKQLLKTGILSDVDQELPINNSRSNLSTDHSTDMSATRSPPGQNSPPLHTPSSNELSFDGDVHVTEPEKQRGSILLEHPQDQMLISEPHSQRHVRKKTPPKQAVLPDTIESTPVKVSTRLVRVRTKRYSAQPANLPLLHEQSTQETSDNSSSPENLQVEWPSQDQEMSMTPRASDFDPGKYLQKVVLVERKGSNEGRTRKVSGNQRVRKVSSEGRGTAKDARDSAAEEGDDEGYDDLLSAYESEEGTQFLGI